MLSTLSSLAALLVGGAVFVILFVILGVTLWVSLVAGGVALVLTMATGGGALGSHRRSDAHPRGI
jgi:hypothetical protein